MGWKTAVFLFLATAIYGGEVSTELIDAIHRDDATAALELIESGADPNQKSHYGVTPLHVACINGNTEIIEALLQSGADPNLLVQGGESPLMTAARTGKPDPVRFLLKHGANCTFAGVKDQTALIWAAAAGYAEVCQLLIDAGADPNRVLDSGFTPLLFAARNGHGDVVDVLLKAGADLAYAIEKDKKIRKGAPRGTSALSIAVENGHFELAVKLLEAGADPDDQRSGMSPLHQLTHVRKPNRGDGDDGLPPPRGSGRMTSLEFAEVLLSKFGGNVNLRLKRGSRGGGRFGTKDATPFLLAARKADLPYLKLLKSHGADHTLPNGDGTTALLAAAGVGSRAPEEEAGTEEERLAVLDWLLPLGCDVNRMNRNRETAMHGAAYKNVPEVARWLAKNGADISVWNTKNRKGWTPLLIAQGFRPGNFKPDAATIAAIEELMRAEGVQPPPAPERP